MNPVAQRLEAVVADLEARGPEWLAQVEHLPDVGPHARKLAPVVAEQLGAAAKFVRFDPEHAAVLLERAAAALRAMTQAG